MEYHFTFRGIRVALKGIRLASSRGGALKLIIGMIVRLLRDITAFMIPVIAVAHSLWPRFGLIYSFSSPKDFRIDLTYSSKVQPSISKTTHDCFDFNRVIDLCASAMGLHHCRF